MPNWASNCLSCADSSGTCLKALCKKTITVTGITANKKKTTCCNDGQYNGGIYGKTCKDCPDGNCITCSDGVAEGTSCLRCKKIIKTSQSVIANIKKTSCCNNIEQYKPNNGSNCIACPDDNCKICNDGSGQACIKCKSRIKATNIVAKLKKTSCCAIDNQYYKNGSCQDCDSNCSMCKDVSGDCLNCIKKIKGTYSVDMASHCCAQNTPKAYWKAAINGCAACPDENCDECQNNTGDCLHCSKKIYIKPIVVGIKTQPSCCSNENEYYSDNTCKTCPTLCDICKDASGDCLKCTDNDKIKFNSVEVRQKKTSCCQDDDKYWSSNNKCENCPDNNCVMCDGASGDCMRCKKYIKASSYRVGVKRCCDPGNNYSTQASDCVPCTDTNCIFCENISGTCLECSKKIKINAVAGLKQQPSCCVAENQYYENFQRICLDCSSNCNICEDGSGNCLKCSPKIKFNAVAVSRKKTSCCTNGNFWNQQDKKCELCLTPCKSCEDVTGICICDKKILFKAAATMKPTSCCDYGKYLDNNSCKNCKDNCIECTDGTGDCIRRDEEFIVTTVVYNTGGSCCPDGFYYQNGKCNVRPPPCITCTSASKCTSCTALATYDKVNNACICKSGYYKSATNCERCQTPCDTCSSVSVCSSCRKHATLDSSAKQCNCDFGFSLNSTDVYGYCTANCNYLCTECSIDDGDKCSKCITNAELSGNKCSCTPNSSYNANSKSCVCNDGYILEYNKCIGCKKYLSPTDVKSVVFSSTWTSININFNTKIDTKLDPACSKIFSSDTLPLLGAGPICSWPDQKTLKVVFGSLFTLRGQTMYLDGTYLVKDAILTGPSSVSLSCGASDPLKYSGEKSTMSIGSMTYAWDSTISPKNSQLSNFIKSTKTGSLTIPRSLFDISVTTTLNLTLEVTNYFGIKNKAWLVTTVTGESSLTVIFDQGTSITMKASSSTSIKAKINSLCANSTSSTFSWVWKYYSGPKIDSASILQNAKDDKLTINKNALAATTDTLYVFMAIATQSYNGATISGNSTISITVTSSPLSIQLSKTSSDVSPDSDYTVDASGSKDPDNSSRNLTYLWTCLNSVDATTCTGNDGKTLLDGEKSVNLKIPASRLVKGAQWDINCTISKDTRTASATISLKVLNTTLGSQAEITLKAQKYNPQGTNQFSASVTSNY